MAARPFRSADDVRKVRGVCKRTPRGPVNPRASCRSDHARRIMMERIFFGLRRLGLNFADFGAFRFFVLADFFDTGMVCVCYRLILAKCSAFRRRNDSRFDSFKFKKGCQLFVCSGKSRHHGPWSSQTKCRSDCLNASLR